MIFFAAFTYALCFLQLGDISVSKMMWFVFLINLEMRPLWHIGMYYIRL